MRRAIPVILVALACSMVGRWAERRFAAERVAAELRIIAAAPRSLVAIPVSGDETAIPSKPVSLRAPQRAMTPLRQRVVRERARARSSGDGLEVVRVSFFAAPKETATQPRVDAILVGPSQRRVKLRARARSEWYEEGELCDGWEVVHIAVGGVVLTHARRSDQRMVRLPR